MQINWNSFELYNPDPKGINSKFEDLCRQIFINDNLSNNKNYKYVCANPNNPGLETEPIFDETRNIYIGFQAKYFDNNPDYRNINDSARKIVKYYKGRIDLVFLFCNKDLASGSLETARSVLGEAGIELVLVTGNTILDRVRNYPYLGLYYFGNHTICHEWFVKHSNEMFNILGKRYNQLINVDTTSSDELSLFVHDKNATEYLNAKKEKLLIEIDECTDTFRYKDYVAFLENLKEAVLSLKDVSEDNLYCSEDWFSELHKSIVNDIESLTKRIEEINAAIKDIDYKIEGRKAKGEFDKLANEKAYVIEIMNLPYLVELTDREKQLLHGKSLFINGRAGIGKSQLLAYETEKLLNDDREVLLLIAGIYYSDEPIINQIINNLGFDIGFYDLIDILECIGEKNNTIVPIFIDALNETWNKQIWKNGLYKIVEKIYQSPKVRLVISYRQEFHNSIFSNAIQQRLDNCEILSLTHTGFEYNSFYAVKRFLNYYGISFTPLECFGYDVTNPLFLTLYCETYTGDDVDIPSLYDKFIEHINKRGFETLGNELREAGYSEDDNLVKKLVDEISRYYVDNKKTFLTHDEIVNLSFWTEVGISPHAFILLLVREGFLHDYCNSSSEYYYFEFDHLNDYYCAKAIINRYSKEDVGNTLSGIVSNINEDNSDDFWTPELIANICVLYEEKYDDVCFDLFVSLEDEEKRDVFVRQYINAFQWRNPNYIVADRFERILKEFSYCICDFFPMLIGNSVKCHHPLNADYLHCYLLSLDLNKRDYLWTIYVNGLVQSEGDRLVQLVQMYDSGEIIEYNNEKQIELLLTLFGWILTSSNRWLRDYTSKAMIEILKDNFHLCQVILNKFETVNDPYVIQRLYGVVFGACCKRKNNESIKDLAEYVYLTVFRKDTVYPDILLRDYARLIVELFLYDNPDYDGIIERERIVPPYNSDPIPVIKDQHFQDKKYEGGMYRLIESMRFEGMDGYGDFGRYVFQSSLRSFDVDDYEIFNYSIYHILNDIGYSEDYFGEYDKGKYYERELLRKCERIGKKYQWITMYNILARVSDHHKLNNYWRDDEGGQIKYEGPWEPYVRDFDPTLNKSFLKCNEAPIFNDLQSYISNGENEIKSVNHLDAEENCKWRERKGVFLDELNDTLVLMDNSSKQWVCLTRFCETNYNLMAITGLQSWNWLYAYFVTEEQKETFINNFNKGLNLLNREISSFNESYSIFNREYPWSPSCKEFNNYAWVDAKIKTGNKKLEAKTIPVLDEAFLDELVNGVEQENDGVSVFKMKDIVDEIDEECTIGKMLHATTDLIWEEEYDASKETSISYRIPCADFIETMGLKQKESDTFYYDSSDKLAAFDTYFTQGVNGVVVRKDILDSYLEKKNNCLIWFVQAEKRSAASSGNGCEIKAWEGLFYYDNDNIGGGLIERKYDY